MSDTLAELAARVERMEALWSEVCDHLGVPKIRRNDVPAEFIAADGAVHHTPEQARWVMQGDWIQAAHGDTDWAEVLHPPTHSEGHTGLVTRRADGTERIRWWEHTDLVRVATAPVPDPAPWRAEHMGVA